MNPHLETFNEMKRFINFSETDVENLKKLGPIFEEYGPALTEGFYDTLQSIPTTAKVIEGRLEPLRKTHQRWMRELFEGDYGSDYFENRFRIGDVHVIVGIEPFYVEAVMDVIRTGGLAAIFAELERDEAIACSQSLLKILDLDLLVINLAYNEERLDRLTAFTGFSRKLIETCIKRAAKKS